MDEFPRLRIGFAECSGGWVAGWLNRLDYQQAYLSRTLPETKRTPTEYAHSPAKSYMPQVYMTLSTSRT